MTKVISDLRIGHYLRTFKTKMRETGMRAEEPHAYGVMSLALHPDDDILGDLHAMVLTTHVGTDADIARRLNEMLDEFLEELDSDKGCHMQRATEDDLRACATDGKVAWWVLGIRMSNLMSRSEERMGILDG